MRYCDALTFHQRDVNIPAMTRTPNELSTRLAFKPFCGMLQFGGRSTRTELISFWLLYTCAVLAITFLLMVISIYDAGFGFGANDYVALLFYAAFWLPAPALIARRMQDVGWPGAPGALFVATYGATVIYWTIVDPLYRLPLSVRIVVSLIALALFVASLWNDSPGSNRYGPNPRLDLQPDARRIA